MRMRVLAIVGLAYASCLSGCHRRIGTNNLPVVVNRDELIAVRELINKYRTSPDTVTKVQRNDLIERLLGISDDHYIALRNRLLDRRNAYSFAGEVTATTLSSVSALLGDADLKSILSTASSLTQSTKTSVDKNFFANTSTEALVTKMDALRASQRATITRSETSEMEKYGLETALNDVRKYDDSGTLQAALIAIASNAASQKQEAETELKGAIRESR